MSRMSRMSRMSPSDMSYGGGFGSSLVKGFAALNKGLAAADVALKATDATLKNTKTLVQQGKRISGQAKKITGGGYQCGGQVKVGYHTMPDGRVMKDSDHQVPRIQTGGEVIQTKAAQVQPNSVVQVKAKDVKNQSTQVQVKQGQVVQVKSLPRNQLVQATTEEVRPSAQVLANPQDVQTTRSLDILVQAKPSDLKQSQVVLVNKQAVQPSQQARVVKVTSDQVLAKPAQLKQGQLVQVPIQNVKGTKQLHQTVQGLSTQKPRQQQKGGASSDFVGSFYANTVAGGVQALSEATRNGLSSSPMFNPLNMNTTFPTMPSTGIIPTGIVMSRMV